MRTLSEELSRYTHDFDPTLLPEDVVTAAMDSVLDTVGCAIGGSTTPVADAVRQAVGPGSPGGGARVIGHRDLAYAPEAAAFVNATAAHSLELDDTDAESFCHTGAVVIPACLAVAQDLDVSGPEFLASVVIGYDVTVRIARWLNPAHRKRGFHTTATAPTIGAAAAVSRLYRSSPAETMSAIGIACSFSAGTFEFLTDGASLKRVHAGKASAGAITAARLARGGVTGPRTALEGPAGLYATLADREVPTMDLDDLGTRFLVRETGRKPYPCCRFCHTPIDAAVALYHRGLRSRDIARVRVLASRLCIHQTGNTNPHNELQRQFSTPYGVALGLVAGELTIADYRETPNREALAIARLVELRVDPGLSFSDRAATVEVTTHNDVTYKESRSVPLGEPSNPIAPDRLKVKFLDLAGRVYSAEDAESLHSTISVLHRADRLGPILGPSRGSP